MKEFGENIGIAFQIRDDILDYEVNGLTGKTIGNDVKERKITLPLIHALETASPHQKSQILSIVRSRKKTKQEINRVIEFVISSGGIEYAELKMNQFRDKALAILDSYPESEVKDSLKRFVHFTTARDK
jgi:octaprenyl-diphosphate synthase